MHADKPCMALVLCLNLLSSLLPHLTFCSSTAVALPWCPHHVTFSVPSHLSSPRLQSFTHTETYSPWLWSPFPHPPRSQQRGSCRSSHTPSLSGLALGGMPKNPPLAVLPTFSATSLISLSNITLLLFPPLKPSPSLSCPKKVSCPC